eukprot:5522116-Prymnesium_polylepis.1
MAPLARKNCSTAVCCKRSASSSGVPVARTMAGAHNRSDEGRGSPCGHVRTPRLWPRPHASALTVPAIDRRESGAQLLDKQLDRV